MIDRPRPQRAPFIPLWVILTIVALILASVAAVGFAFWQTEGSRVEVPDVVGLDETEASNHLLKAGLTPEVVERPLDPAPEGTVLSQEQSPGTVLAEDSVVRLVVSAGDEEFEMPDLIGKNVRVARAQLEDLGLVVRITPLESEMPKDIVLTTNPPSGATMRISDIVRLTVAAEGSASDALLPYPLAGMEFVIDPSPVMASSVDASLEVARRLSALLEASGAAVHITRSTNTSDTTDAARLAAVAGLQPTAFIGLDAVLTAEGGRAVTILASESAPATFTASKLLSASLAKEMVEASGEPPQNTVTNDLLLRAVPSPGVRIRLGSFNDQEDASAFLDPAWIDEMARSIYRGIGERFGT